GGGLLAGGTGSAGGGSGSMAARGKQRSETDGGGEATAETVGSWPIVVAGGSVPVYRLRQQAPLSTFRRSASAAVRYSLRRRQRAVCPAGRGAASPADGMAPALGDRRRRFLRDVLRQVHREKAADGSDRGGAALRRGWAPSAHPSAVRGLRRSG